MAISLHGFAARRASHIPSSLNRYASLTCLRSTGLISRFCQSRRLVASRSIQTFSQFSSAPAASTSTLPPSTFRPRHLPRSRQLQHLHQARTFSLWPSKTSPAPVVDADSKLEKPAAATPAPSPDATVQPPSTASPPASSTNANVEAAATPNLPTESTSPATSESVVQEIKNLPHELQETLSETRRTLSEYGLGGGGFVGRTQDLLEWIHLTTGLPWWATIGTAVLGIRLLLLPFVVKGVANNARLAVVQPQLMQNIKAITRLKKEGMQNSGEITKIQMQTKKLLSDNNCHPIKGFIVPILQMPVFFCFFFALRGMANAGLPDFATGGLAWFPNLSAPDPYYVLPIMSAAATLAVLRVGEAGAPEPTGGAKAVKNIFKLATPVIAWVTSSFPAAVLVYWVTHNSFSVLQAYLLQTPYFRKLANIPDPPKRDAAAASKDPTGFLQAFKETREAFSEEVEKAKERTEQKIAEQTAAKTGQQQRDEELAAARKRAEQAKKGDQASSKSESTTTGSTFSEKLSPAEARRKRVAEARWRVEAKRMKKSRV